MSKILQLNLITKNLISLIVTTCERNGKKKTNNLPKQYTKILEKYSN